MDNRNIFGDFINQKLIERKMSLRELARKTGIDVGNLSKIERGLAYPPQKSETLKKIADAFELSSEEETELIDKAYHVNGMLPAQLESVKENAAIPVLLRTINSKQLSEEQVRKLAEAIDSQFEWVGRVID